MIKRELDLAKANKQDDFYTSLSVVEDEMRHHTKNFKNKTIFCNCDDPRSSKFFHYFAYNFEKLGIKKLITTCYKNQNRDLFSTNNSEKAVFLEYEGDKNGNKIPDIEEIGVKELKGDGDFRSQECVELLKQSDIVVTNPPFSLFREYVDQLIKYKKKFIIIGNQNAITYKETFRLFLNNKIWIGASIHSGDREFQIPKDLQTRSKSLREDEEGKRFIKVPGVRWFTNLDFKQRHEDIILYKKYNHEEFPTYDNYQAIEVSKTKEIPLDYSGVMGVPISFLLKHNPDQFDILGLGASAGYDREIVGIPFKGEKDARCLIKGKNTYARIFIKNKRI